MGTVAALFFTGASGYILRNLSFVLEDPALQAGPRVLAKKARFISGSVGSAACGQI